MGGRKGGDCIVAGNDVIEFCVFDKINGSVEPPNVVKKCTEKYFWFHIPKNDKAPNLTGKFICLARSYKT